MNTHTAATQRFAACAVLLACSGWGMGPAAANPLGLMQAYEAALQNDPGLRSALASAQAGREQVNIGRAQLLPTLSYNHGRGHSRSEVDGAENKPETRSYKSASGSLQLRQPLIHMAGWAAYRQGVALSAASEAQLQAQKQDFVVRLFEAYANALFSKEDQNMARSQLDTLIEQQTANEHLLAKGEGTLTEVLETRAKRAMAHAQWIEATDKRTSAYSRLTAMTGLPVGTLAPLRPSFQASATTGQTLDDWNQTAREKNAILLSLQARVDAAGEAVNKAQSGHFPRLDLVASSGRNESDTVSTIQQKYRTTSLGFQLNLPLIAGGETLAQARQAQALLDQSRAELDGKTIEVQQEVQQLFQLLHSGAQRLHALQSALESSRNLVEATRKSVIAGVRTNLDVLFARERLGQVERDLASARYKHLLTGLRLRNAAGVLSETDLREVASHFTAN